MIELRDTRDGAGRVQCPDCGEDITRHVEAQLSYYEALGRVVYRARQAEQRRLWEQRLQVVLVVAGAILFGLFLSPATRESVSPVVGGILLIAWLVGLWRVFSGRD